MSDEGIVGNLTYLSGYLSETKARVRELEEELEEVKKSPTKDESSISSMRIQRLESENAALRQELAVAKTNGRVKKEKTDVGLESHPDVDLFTAKPPNSVLADSHQMCRDLEKKCADLENRIQETTGLAAKALRERVEGEKTLDSVRLALRELQKINDKANEVTVAEIEGKDAAIANLRSEYETLKKKNKTLHAEYKTNHETVIMEKEELQLTLQEMIEVVEGLQEEVAVNTDCGQLLHKVSDECDMLQLERKNLEEKCTSLEAELVGFKERDLEFEQAKVTQANAKYRKYMKALPLPENQPQFGDLEPICYRENNLHAYLSQDPNAKSFLNHLLYLPKRTMHMFDFQFVAFGPTHRYDQATKKWTEGSDLTSVHGGTRELFIDRKEFVYYMGTYKCHDLRQLHPEGTRSPAHISSPEIKDAALGVPRPSGYQKIVERCYPDGIIKVEATGLQCIGFNIQLYKSLRRRFAKDCTGKTPAKEGKRKAENEMTPTVAKKHKS